MVACQPSKAANGPGLHAPARLVLALLLASGLAGVPAFAQQRPPSQAQPSQVPVPDSLELNKLVWSTMAAIDHANLAGNYSVLRDLSAPNFQILNDSAKLASIFASLRASGIDLSNALLLAPTFSAPPRLPQRDVLELRGYFGLRPTAISFELYYQWVVGRWRLVGVSILPANLAAIQPGRAPAAPPPAAPAKPPAPPPTPKRN